MKKFLLLVCLMLLVTPAFAAVGCCDDDDDSPQARGYEVRPDGTYVPYIPSRSDGDAASKSTAQSQSNSDAGQIDASLGQR